MTGAEDHGGREALAPVIALFGRRDSPPGIGERDKGDERDDHGERDDRRVGATSEQREPAEPPLRLLTPVSTSPINAWVSEENPASQSDAEGWWVPEDDGENDAADVRPLGSARSVANRDDESASRLRHPTALPKLMRASELIKPETERTADVDIPTARSADASPTHTPGDAVSPSSPDRSSPAERSDRSRPPRLRVIEDHTNHHGSGDSAYSVDSEHVGDDPGDDCDPGEQRADAERSLLRKLRSKGLSVSEARSFLRGHGYSAEIQDDLIDEFTVRKYLDDEVLAEQIVYAGTTRKGQGRRAIALALSARGIDRTVIDAALGELPDDDAERALEYARTKANSMARLEPAVALRRLMGQLARRGFGGSVARDAAQTALREVTGPRFR